MTQEHSTCLSLKLIQNNKNGSSYPVRLKSFEPEVQWNIARKAQECMERRFQRPGAKERLKAEGETEIEVGWETTLAN